MIKELVDKEFNKMKGSLSDAIWNVACALDTSPSTIRKLYYGHREPSAKLLKKLEVVK